MFQINWRSEGWQSARACVTRHDVDSRHQTADLDDRVLAFGRTSSGKPGDYARFGTYDITFCKCVYSRENKKPSAWWCSFPRTLVRKYFQPLVCTANNPCFGRSLTKLFAGGPGRHFSTSQSGRSASGVPGMKRDDAMAFPRGLVTTILHMVVVWLAHPDSYRDRVMKIDRWRFKSTL